MTESKAIIFGCSGTRLTDEETAFFADERPWGLILFARNIGEAAEIADLTARFRDIVGRADAPVFIDQEGGRVQRIRQPIAPDYPSGAVLGALYRKDRARGLHTARLMSRLHAADLLPLGINADCLPVLDVPVPGAHDVIGDRAYGHDAHSVAEMGRAAAEGLLEGGVLPVIKHIPGHGRSLVDSHKALPVVDADIDTLTAVDFEPFRQLAEMPMAMTAHVVFTALDADNPATTSARVIEDVIRTQIGFDGLLMTDDLSMRALSGDFSARTKASLSAGCDLVLHCNGLLEEMRPVAEAAPHLSGKALERADRATAMVRKHSDAATETAALRDEFDRLVATVA
ncbi:MAG: beta-N-acetylhexosaminidase [Roseitalea sp.]|jgi:beta-N-acetylhexosaminidase|nr:beta-N-acetylhexosaminidase [Roseitalea sp.]MBO6721748.1 beta-N-acetylhexosaminidase [Roseitalea sp.]MBO6741644.1 beta-N-acetylhexosaminidase [Roseitalea sp.]